MVDIDELIIPRNLRLALPYSKNFNSINVASPDKANEIEQLQKECSTGKVRNINDYFEWSHTDYSIYYKMAIYLDDDSVKRILDSFAKIIKSGPFAETFEVIKKKFH